MATFNDPQASDPALGDVTELAESLTANSADRVDRFRRLGKWILDTFFGGEPRRYRAECRKDPAWKVCKRGRLTGLSPDNLANAIAVAENFRELHDEVCSALSVSQHRFLGTISDPRRKHRLAREAVEQHWTVVKLRLQGTRGPVADGHGE